MTLTKAEALFHLTEFEQALLHFHNGLVSSFATENNQIHNVLGLSKSCSIFTIASWVFAHLGFHVLQVVGKWRYEKV